MGCCISSNEKNLHPSNAASKAPVVREYEKTQVNNRAPPPCLEEETVKEVVLSESRLPKPLTPKDNTTQMCMIEEHSVVAKDMINKQEEETSQVSQVSEVHSISESFSTNTTATTTTTATLTERREDEAVSKLTSREVNHRSPATKVPRKRPNAGDISRGAKSAAKKAEKSRAMSRSVPGRTMPRNVGPATGERRESGEGPSVRRSRSPAIRTTGGVPRRSPDQVSERPGDRLRAENAGKEEVVNDGLLKEKSESNECLDNPHVSLECFIFL